MVSSESKSRVQERDSALTKQQESIPKGLTKESSTRYQLATVSSPIEKVKMAPIPPMLIRAATIFLTTALTRKLQQSPLFFRVVDRLIHEIDHLPHRINGKPVQYRRIDPQEPTLTEQAQDAWNNRCESLSPLKLEWMYSRWLTEMVLLCKVDDPGEPHDLPNPFASSAPQKSIPDTFSANASSSSASSVQSSRTARDSRQTSRTAQRRTQQPNQREKTQEPKGDAKMDEMRSMLERLRETRQQDQDRLW